MKMKAAIGRALPLLGLGLFLAAAAHADCTDTDINTAGGQWNFLSCGPVNCGGSPCDYGNHCATGTCPADGSTHYSCAPDTGCPQTPPAPPQPPAPPVGCTDSDINNAGAHWTFLTCGPVSCGGSPCDYGNHCATGTCPVDGSTHYSCAPDTGCPQTPAAPPHPPAPPVGCTDTDINNAGAHWTFLDCGPVDCGGSSCGLGNHCATGACPVDGSTHYSCAPDSGCSQPPSSPPPPSSTAGTHFVFTGQHYNDDGTALLLAPNSSQQVTVQMFDATGKSVGVQPDMTASVSAPCVIDTQGAGALALLYQIGLRSGAAVGSCNLQVTASGVTGSIPVTVGNKLLFIDSPADKGSAIYSNDSPMVTISGIEAGPPPADIHVSGVSCGPVQVKSFDPVSGINQWFCNWPSPTPGAHSVTVSADGMQKSADFSVFGPPLPPTIILTTDVFVGAPVLYTAQHVTDNPANPPGHSTGVSGVLLVDAVSLVTVAAMTQSTLGNWTYTLPVAADPPVVYRAITISNQGLYSLPSAPIKYRIHHRPTGTISSPVSGQLYRTGSKVTLSVDLVDPDFVTDSISFDNSGNLAAVMGCIGVRTCSTSMTAITPNGSAFSVLTATIHYTDLDGKTPLTADAGNVHITVVDTPTLVTPAIASPNPVVNGLTTELTVLAKSNVFGTGGLNYQWSAAPGSPAPVTFDFNGTNPTLQATFSKPGSYLLTAAITDPLGSVLKSSTTVTVNAGLQITPSPAFALVGKPLQLSTTGKDQFGNPAAAGGNSWSSDCSPSVGSIDAAGLFTATGLGGPCTVTVTAGSQSGSTTLMVTEDIPPTVQMTSLTPSNTTYMAPMDITMAATASDADDAVQSVRFYANDFPIGDPVTQAPYTYIWHNMQPGNYRVTAMAVDVRGSSTTSAAMAVAVHKPLIVITHVTPSSTTTQDNSQGHVPFIFTVEGTGFVPGGPYPASYVTWDGHEVFTRLLSGDILDSVLEVTLNDGELLNPHTAAVQVVNPVDPFNVSGSTNVSSAVSFIVDGKPIISCVDLSNRGNCNADRPFTRGGTSSGSSDGTTITLLPQLTRNDQVGVVSQFTGGGIRWSLLPVGSHYGSGATILFQSAFMPGTSFNLSSLPSGIGSGNYVIVAEGRNLMGLVSSPAEASFFLVSSNLNTVRVYPDPWRSDQHASLPLTFDRMTPGSTLKIFTVSGHWVQTLIADGLGAAAWDRKNSSGDSVQSGLYLYLVTDSQGNKARGKFAIIR